MLTTDLCDYKQVYVAVKELLLLLERKTETGKIETLP